MRQTGASPEASRVDAHGDSQDRGEGNAAHSDRAPRRRCRGAARPADWGAFELFGRAAARLLKGIDARAGASPREAARSPKRRRPSFALSMCTRRLDERRTETTLFGPSALRFQTEGFRNPSRLLKHRAGLRHFVRIKARNTWNRGYWRPCTLCPCSSPGCPPTTFFRRHAVAPRRPKDGSLPRTSP